MQAAGFLSPTILVRARVLVELVLSGGLCLLRYSFLWHPLALGFDLLPCFGHVLRRTAKAYCPRVYGNFEQRLVLKITSGRTVPFESITLIFNVAKSTNCLSSDLHIPVFGHSAPEMQKACPFAFWVHTQITSLKQMALTARLTARLQSSMAT